MFDGISKPLVLAATSDIHGCLEGIQEVCSSRGVEILVIAGDIEPADIFTSKPYWFEHKFFHLVSKLDCDVVAIPGNHDFYLSGKYAAIKRGECKHIPKNFHLLVDEEVTIRGIRFYGTPWVPYIDGRWCFEGVDEDLSDRFSMMPTNVDVLITHSPPRLKYCEIDVSCDNSMERRRHFGSLSLKNVIEARAPRMVLCGHIHSGDHRCISITSGIDNSPIYMWNVSRVNEQYNIAYKIKLLELNPHAIREMPFDEKYYGTTSEKAHG
jgi:Icc-related predicted phosphoesterase